MKEFFKELFEYSHHHNQMLWKVFNEHQTTEKAVKLFNHILNAHQIWNYRIDPLETVPDVWEIRQMSNLKEIDRSNYEGTLRILDVFDFGKVINYKTSTGSNFSNSTRDILFHIINHSTYHHGQIAMDFRQSGLEPLASDFIFYKR